jgi:transcriptional regulator with XRE-family HTH domain
LLVAARDRADLRQTEVAERLGRSQTWVSRIEAGERRIDVVELYLLARLFELDPRELLRQIWPPE